jgi:serine/threonine protein kinase
MADIQTRFQALSQFHLRYTDLKLERSIGAGSYGEVWVGRTLNSNHNVAIKKLHRADADSTSLEMYCREVESLSSATHPFILPFIGFTTQSPFCIVTKFIPNDSLFNALHEDPKSLQLTPLDLSVIAYGIADGMSYLHSISFIHRDMKSENILLDENKLPVICDFGSSRRVNPQEALKTGEIGTPNYMAPEFIRAEAYTQKVDVYSYGMILWEMLTRTTPFSGMVHSQVIFQVIVKQARPEIPAGTPDALSSLIQSCWAADPGSRPEFSAIARAWKSGAVAFPGCDAKSFQSRVLTKPVPTVPTVPAAHGPLAGLAERKEARLKGFRVAAGKSDVARFPRAGNRGKLGPAAGIRRPAALDERRKGVRGPRGNFRPRLLDNHLENHLAVHHAAERRGPRQHFP